MYATNLSIDIDTGTLTLRLNDGSEYLIANPLHAQTIRTKIKPGTVITDDQMVWLAPHRVQGSGLEGRERLKTRLRKMRQEIHDAQRTE